MTAADPVRLAQENAALRASNQALLVLARMLIGTLADTTRGLSSALVARDVAQQTLDTEHQHHFAPLEEP